VPILTLNSAHSATPNFGAAGLFADSDETVFKLILFCFALFLGNKCLFGGAREIGIGLGELLDKWEFKLLGDMLAGSGFGGRRRLGCLPGITVGIGLGDEVGEFKLHTFSFGLWFKSVVAH